MNNSIKEILMALSDSPELNRASTSKRTYAPLGTISVLSPKRALDSQLRWEGCQVLLNGIWIIGGVE